MEKAVGGLNQRERADLIALLKKLGLDAQSQLDGEGSGKD
jgi:hypothetical protein